MSDLEDNDVIIESDIEEEDDNFVDNVNQEEGDDTVEDGEDDEDGEDGEDDEDGEDGEDGIINGDDDGDNTNQFGGTTHLTNETMMDYIGGGQDDDDSGEINEDIMGDGNKKIAHHDNVVMLHPEIQAHNYDEIHKASIVTRNDNNIIIDKLHTTLPIMTKYEKAKILGQRTKQLDQGSKPFVTLSKPVMDNSIVAEEELYEKKLPFIIQRPLPGGGFEYWHVKDLEIIRDN